MNHPTLDIAVLALIIWGTSITIDAQAQSIDSMQVHTYTMTGIIVSDRAQIVQIEHIPTERECEETVNEMRERTAIHSEFEGMCTRALLKYEGI